MGTTHAIEIEEICRSIFKNTILDIYYLIMTEPNITKTEIRKKFMEFDEQPDVKITKYRALIDIGIAKLEGAMFIQSWADGLNERYFLTPYGEMAKDIVGHLINENPVILNGSKITAKIMYANN